MNVLLINGSPHKEGCTYHALCEVAKTLNAAGIETTIYHIGPAPVGGCVGCGGCAKAGHCVFGGPVVDVLPLVEKADGIVFGAPVHYATAAGSTDGNNMTVQQIASVEPPSTATLFFSRTAPSPKSCLFSDLFFFIINPLSNGYSSSFILFYLSFQLLTITKIFPLSAVTPAISKHPPQ